MLKKTRDPFGQADCESELKMLKSEYSKLYFDEAPFNATAIDSETYLIIGRRGSGKTALSQFFSFQKVVEDPIYIDVDEPAAYQQVLADIAARASESREIAIPRLMRIWEYVIWRLLFERTSSESPAIAAACGTGFKRHSVSQIVNGIIEHLLTTFHDANGKYMAAHMEQLLTEEGLKAAKAEVLEIAAKRSIIIAIDTLEKYDIDNAALVSAMAALIQSAAEFNLDYAHHGIHLKVFVAGEFFPHLKEEVLQNPAKSLKHPVHLLWRPKDLLRLICWRYFRHLDDRGLLRSESRGAIDWEDHRQVMEKMWRPYFGLELTNAGGLRERTFSYILRHTQMRPRQLILLCNSVARRSSKTASFPSFAEDDIRLAVREAENDLASEIINSFSCVYPHVSAIVDALMKMPIIFNGNELDKRARQSASEWPGDSYSPAQFRRLVAELGIVGRVRRRNDHAGYIDADFEYSLENRLSLTHRDECVIHPMFYERLNVVRNSRSRVMPFSTEREVKEADGEFS